MDECGRVWTSVCTRARVCVHRWAQSRRRMPRALRWMPQGCAHRRSRILLPSEVEPLPARILARAQHEVGIRPALPVRGPLVALPRLVGAILERILLRALCAGAARASLRARKHRHIRAVRMCRLYLRIGPPACVRWPRRPAELRRRVACRAKFRLYHGTPADKYVTRCGLWSKGPVAAAQVRRSHYQFALRTLANEGLQQLPATDRFY